MFHVKRPPEPGTTVKPAPSMPWVLRTPATSDQLVLIELFSGSSANIIAAVTLTQFAD
jgi:hypothetical protein